MKRKLIISIVMLFISVIVVALGGTLLTHHHETFWGQFIGCSAAICGVLGGIISGVFAMHFGGEMVNG